MILLLDGGNTRLKWGLRQGGAWLAQGALERERIGELLRALPAGARLERILFCNVAGPEVAAAVAQALATVSPGLETFASTPSRAGVRNGYERPTQLGADRWAALIGAWGLVGDSCLVVSAGTALTVDVLERDGHGDGGGAVFRGGLILPGFDLMRGALATKTAQLPLATGHYADLPGNTDDAIVSGCLHALAGAVERLGRQLPPGTPWLLSGGGADLLLPHLGGNLRRVDNLVLEGLARAVEALPPG
ncbi:MAG: type III pantothenate kinase [Betaproteobacteria bacterium]|nr:type III pantothenate kinase [Betaproteobacteria bacterium]